MKIVDSEPESQNCRQHSISKKRYTQNIFRLGIFNAELFIHKIGIKYVTKLKYLGGKNLGMSE